MDTCKQLAQLRRTPLAGRGLCSGTGPGGGLAIIVLTCVVRLTCQRRSALGERHSVQHVRLAAKGEVLLVGHPELGDHAA